MRRVRSAAAGVFAAWRPDGKEPYYLNPFTVTGSTLEPGVRGRSSPASVSVRVDGDATP